MAKRLMRTPSDEMLGGVCGGLGKYFEIDSNLIRLLFVVLAVVPGFGIPVYVVLWLILPEEEKADTGSLADRVRDGAEEIVDRAKKLGPEERSSSRSSNRTAILAIGAALIIVGIVFLLRNLGITWFHWMAFGTAWPVVLILVGAAFLWRWIKGGD